jgi:uncharacterized protein YxeA
MKKLLSIILSFILAMVIINFFNKEEDNTGKNVASVKQETNQKAKNEDKPKPVNIKVDHSKQSADDDDNSTTRAIEPGIVKGLKTLNPNQVKEVIVNVNLAKKTPAKNDTSVILDVLFATGTENKDKEKVFVEVAKQLHQVKNLHKFTVWTYEKKMYNPENENEYMMVVYTKHLPSTSQLTFDQLVDSSNNGSINGEMYFNQNRD